MTWLDIKVKCHNIIDEADKIHKIKTSISVVQNLDLTCNCNRTWTSHERFVNITLYFFSFWLNFNRKRESSRKCIMIKTFQVHSPPCLSQTKVHELSSINISPRRFTHLPVTRTNTTEGDLSWQRKQKKLLFHNEYRSISARINYNSRRYPVATENHAATEHNQHDLQQLQGTSH